MQLFQYLLYTLLIELPFVVLAYHKNWKTTFITGILLNLFTWPILVLLYHYTNIPVLLLESGVVVTEAIGFKLFFEGPWWKALLVSLVANTASYLTGIWISSAKLVL